MIPQAAIIEWREIASWKTVSMVEQDLIISRAIVEIFNDPYLSPRLALRGGTALHKLYLLPTARYSEDIDLVQVEPEPIKNTIMKIQDFLSVVVQLVVFLIQI